MSVKVKLKHSLMLALQSDHTKSYTSKYDRKRLLVTFVNDLFKLGYMMEDVRSLKPKHITAVVTHWKSGGLSSGSIKNRLAAIRMLARVVGKAAVIPSNKALLIPPRKYVSTTNRAVVNPDFKYVQDENIKMSLELQRVFGLRREESLKIQPYTADNKKELILLSSWCKGGRGRSIPIRTKEQRDWLEKAKKFVIRESDSLIPPGKTYKQQRNLYDQQVYRAGLRNLHGLRHGYAQRRYKEITGFEAPINGGPGSKQLTKIQKALDYDARKTISEELGHCRRQITVNYLGR